MIGSYCKNYSKNMNKKEHENLNRSFLSLGNVITSLHKTNQIGNDDWKSNALTKTLYPLINTETPSKLLLFLNCSTKKTLHDETLATLRYGNLANLDPLLLTVMDNYRKKIKLLNNKLISQNNNNNNNNIII